MPLLRPVEGQKARLMQAVATEDGMKDEEEKRKDEPESKS